MHHWQDIVLAGSIVVFNIALIPSVATRHKPALGTSLLTATFLIPVLAAYLSLGLWFASLMTAINMLLWTVLFVQQYLRKHGKTARRIYHRRAKRTI